MSREWSRTPVEMPPTQIGRASAGVGNRLDSGAQSRRPKGGWSAVLLTAQDRLVKGMRVAGVTTLEQANHYLENRVSALGQLPHLAVVPANADDAHRPLEKQHDLAAILSHVESRRVNNDYTIQLDTKIYQIARQDIRTGLRGAVVRVEKRRDGSVAVRFRDRYLGVSICEQRPKLPAPKPPGPARRALRPSQTSEWCKNFDLKKSPKIWQAVRRFRRQAGVAMKTRHQDTRKAGQNRPGGFALSLFKASAPRLHQSNEHVKIKSKTLGGYPAGPG